MIFGYIFANLIAALLGIMEAMIYGKKGHDSFKRDEHRWIYTPIRTLFFCLAFSFHFVDLEGCFFIFVSAILSFPFFHDGFYYLGRKWIDGAYDGFMDMTTGSTAKISIPPVARFVLFLTGIMLFLIGWW